MDIIYIAKFGYKCIKYKIYSKKIQAIIVATVQGGSANWHWARMELEEI